MKKHTIILLLLSAHSFVWAQDEAQDVATTSDVVVDIVEEPSETPEGAATVVEVPNVEVKDVEIVTEDASESSEAPTIPDVAEALPDDTEIVLEIPGQEAGESGEATIESDETISVDFPDEDVRTILRNVADLFDLNLVIPDTLQGRTSIKLRNITWRQVFEVVLDPLGYTYVEDRNIIRVKSVEEMSAEPVDTRVFVINYANAAEIQGSISPLIDSGIGGQVMVDSRSNALVITERPSRMNKIQEIIERLDKPNHQVMIESRFVEVSRDDAKDIGVDWSFITDDRAEYPATPLAPNTGESGFTSFDGAGFGGFAAPSGFSDGLLAVFNEDDFAATLNALERNTNTKLVSNPTVVVMNNKEALFQVGEDYPLREFTINRQTGELESGQVEYRFVGIELKVTPSVNAQGMISLDVHPTVSARLEDETVSGPDGIEDQIFRTREANTKVTIKDGFTIALGGLTDESESRGRDQIPLLGDVPVLGKLFQSNNSTVTSSNLIIFLTAKTLNPDGTTYREIIDPRMLEAIGHTDSQTPGYQVPHDQLEILEEAEEKREEMQALELRKSVEARLAEQEEAKKTWAEKLHFVEPSK